MSSVGLRVFVVGVDLWYHLQTHWFRGNFRLQAVGVVLLVYWVLGCLVVFTRRKSIMPIGLERSQAGTEDMERQG